MLPVLDTLICAVTHVGSHDTQPFFSRVKCLLGDARTIHAISKTKPKEKGNVEKLRNILYFERTLIIFTVTTSIFRSATLTGSKTSLWGLIYLKFTNRAKDENTKIQLFCSFCLFGFFSIVKSCIAWARQEAKHLAMTLFVNGFPGTLSSSPFVIGALFSVNALTVRENKPITEL